MAHEYLASDGWGAVVGKSLSALRVPRCFLFGLRTVGEAVAGGPGPRRWASRILCFVGKECSSFTLSLGRVAPGSTEGLGA